MFYFEDVAMPSFSTNSEEDALSTSSGDLPPPPPITLPPISPLPELIVERVHRSNCHNKPEEFYDQLEVEVKKHIKKISTSPQVEDVNDTIKIVGTSEDIETNQDSINMSPDNLTYTIVNSSSTKEWNSEGNKQLNSSFSSDHVTEENKKDVTVERDLMSNAPSTAYSNEKSQEPYNHSSKSTINTDKNTLNTLSRSDVEEYMDTLDTIISSGSQVKGTSYASHDDCEERDVNTGSEVENENSAQQTDPNVSNDPEIMRATNRNSIRSTRFSFNPEEDDRELDIYSIPHTAAKRHLEIEEETEDIHEKRNSSLETQHESENFGSDLEENYDMERLETIVDEGKSQLKGTSNESQDDCEERDITTDSVVENEKTSQQTDPNLTNNPEIMRKTNRNSIRSTRFSLTPHGTDLEHDIFSEPHTAASKHSVIQKEREEIDGHSSSENGNLDTSNPNVGFFTTTPKSKIINCRNREVSPKYVNKSQQCDIESVKENSRKRRANDSNTNDQSSGKNAKLKRETLNDKFFVGKPIIFNLCTCKNHKCS